MIRNIKFLPNAGGMLRKTALGAMVAAAGLVPSVASAHGHDRDDRDRHSGVRLDFRIGLGDAPLCFPLSGPAYEERTQRIWVEPVYRTVCDRVWHEPVVQDVCDRVWVEPVYEVRDVVRYEGWRRCVYRERVLVCPGHWEDRHRQVVVSEGYWETIQRQELVTPGHWEYRTVQVRADEGAWWER